MTMKTRKLSVDLVSRLWEKDLSLWPNVATEESIADRLGWLDAIRWMNDHIGDLRTWSDQVLAENSYETVLLLGMGGSSLGAEVFYSVFGKQCGFPSLVVLDSTCPDQIRSVDVDLEKTLIIVSSKSGSTIETADLMQYFLTKLTTLVASPGSHFVAITDPGSALERLAGEMDFRAVFLNPSDIGGRYSVLSYFGLVPAALLGIDLRLLAERTESFAARTREQPESVIELAHGMANLNQHNLNQLILRFDPELRVMSVWIEQLVAESTGKNGLGVIPVLEHLVADPKSGFLVESRLLTSEAPGDADDVNRADLTLNLQDNYDIGAEFLRWKMATALAASMMNINPFDQPNVEEAKIKARQLIVNPIPVSAIFAVSYENFDVFVSNMRSQSDRADDWSVLRSILAENASYIGVLAYLPMSSSVDQRLQSFCRQIHAQTTRSVTLGYGPRYLHSTGQLHKGGPNIGGFIQIVDAEMEDLEIPGRAYGFGRLNVAQSDGDYAVLAEKNLPIMRISLKGDRLRALDNVLEVSQ